MEWISIRTFEYKKQQRACWHRWFAWHPAKVNEFPDGAIKIVWLKTIERCGYPECYYG